MDQLRRRDFLKGGLWAWVVGLMGTCTQLGTRTSSAEENPLGAIEGFPDDMIIREMLRRWGAQTDPHIQGWITDELAVYIGRYGLSVGFFPDFDPPERWNVINVGHKSAARCACVGEATMDEALIKWSVKAGVDPPWWIEGNDPRTLTQENFEAGLKRTFSRA